MVKICDVIKKSLADKAGISSGDMLVSINGNNINDVLDYRFYMTDSKIAVVCERDGKEYSVTIKKDEYDDIGLEFETYLMDSKKSCTNKCVFCFIDQLPSGMRDTLYFKDDDSRLSFLMGNYITLTSLKDSDVDRIIKMHMSPINISVHTTNPDLRCKMMNNRFAGDSLRHLKKLAENGITLNCQIVLCKGLNDGNELINTMHDLATLYPAVNSVSVVPAGLTKHREGLYPLEPFTSDEARKNIKIVESFAALCKKEYGSSIFFCGDEFYLKAGLELPTADYYEEFAQIENGVGMISLMKEEFENAIDDIKEEITESTKPRNISIATGEAAYPFIKSISEKLEDMFPTLSINVYKIKNDFFGENITVAGLITGTDLIAQLKEKDLGETLFLPRTMLESEEIMFLDNVTLIDAQKELDVEIETVNNDGYEFVEAILGDLLR